MSRSSGVGRRARPAAPITHPRHDEAHPPRELGPDGHPFRFDYIGLGLLDEASIRGDGGAWVAEYPDERGRPCLRVRIEPDGPATLEERDEDGRLVATTVGRSLTEAIGRHMRLARRSSPTAACSPASASSRTSAPHDTLARLGRSSLWTRPTTISSGADPPVSLRG